MKVKEYFDNFDMQKIEEKAEESDYWKSVVKFLEDIREKEVTNLSAKQANWLSKISDGINE